jgi:hypothetical protein
LFVEVLTGGTLVCESVVSVRTFTDDCVGVTTNFAEVPTLMAVVYSGIVVIHVLKGRIIPTT